MHRAQRPDGRAPLSFAQQRLWFLDQLTPGSAMYNIPSAVRLTGELNMPAFHGALQAVVDRHEALRTRFASAGDEPVQVIESAVLTDLSALPRQQAEAEARRIAGEEARRPFDLSVAPLLNARLLRIAPDEHALIFCMHHIVSDGWSVGVLIREVSALYGVFSARGELTSAEAASLAGLSELSVQYADFAAWQRERLQGDALDEQLAYWRQTLEGAPALLELPSDRPRPAVQTSNGAVVPLTVGKPTADAIRRLAQTEDATPFSALLAAFHLLLHRYSTQEDVCVGTPIANRTRVELEPLIGFFVNTLVIRAAFPAGLTFRQLVRQVASTVVDAQAHQDVQFEMLVETLRPQRDMSYTPLFQAMFSFQQASPQAARLPGLELSALDAYGGAAKFDLLLNLAEAPDGLEAALEYNTDLFDRSTAERMAAHFVTLMTAAVAQPDAPIASLPLLTDAERDLILDRWNATDVPIDTNATLAERFSAQARRAPNVEAVVAETRDGAVESLTYAELDARSDRLAARLAALAVVPEQVVGLMLERSVDLITGVVGIWKAGAAYVPLDPAYPTDRLRLMLTDSGARVVVTQPDLVDSPVLAGLPEVSAIAVDQGPAEAALDTCPAGPDNLAYIIYTSGSTGRPKGVAVTHRTALNLAGALQEVAYKEAAPGPLRISLNAPLSFDASVQQLVMLTLGHTLVVIPQEIRADAPRLLEFIRRHRLDQFDCVPSQLKLLLQEGLLAPGKWTPSICFPGGEAIDPAMWAQLAAAPATRFYNMYGPTECTVDTVTIAADAAPDRPSIGRPMPNTRAYVLDALLQPVPVGVPGELFLGGAQVARGYLARPELTAERFLPDPFAQGAGSGAPPPRMYRTGDRVRWLPDGRLDFLGRVDFQVKLRGFRIELGEIEEALRQHAGIREAVVLVREDAPGNKRLVAYLVARDGLRPSVAELRRHLLAGLPEYMVPSAFVFLDAMPLTPNAKIDRASLQRATLPAPDAGEDAYVAPRTPTEEVLAGIWASLLGTARVGIEDNFFELGGHSLSATQLVSRVRNALDVELPLRALFETPTVAGLAATVDRLRAEAAGLVPPPINPLPREPDADGNVRLPLSFAQQRLWFLDQLEPGGSLYNIPSAVRLNGTLDLKALRRTFEALVVRHESLRTTFETVDGKPMQVIGPPAPLALPVVDIGETGLGLEEDAVTRFAVEEARKPFDLARGPLLRAMLLRLSDADHVLLLTMHHIISDGWSTGVVIREFAQLYAAFAAGDEAPHLPSLETQYADYALWQRSWLEAADDEVSPLQRQLAYWREQLSGAPALLELPLDRPRPAVESNRGASITFSLPAALTEDVHRISREDGATVFMTLMAAFQALLSRLSGQTDILVGTPIANRTRSELEGIVGFFVNTLVIRARLDGRPSFRQLLRQVRAAALGAYAHQDVPFEKLVDGLDIARDLSHAPLFQTMFALQNAPSSAAHLSDLTLAPIPIHGGTTPFDLTLVMAEDKEGLHGSLEYASDLFDEDTARSFLRYFETLLKQMLSAPDEPIARLEILSDAERRLVLETWNQTAEPVKGICLHEMVTHHARQTPDAPAIIFVGDAGGVGRREVSYAELDREVSRLATELWRLGVAREEVVAISVDKSVEQMVGILGILKAGAAYLPIDPTYPKERVDYLLSDAGVNVLLTQSRHQERFSAAQLCHTVRLDEPVPAPAVAAKRPLAADPAPDNLAYVIYTSGSTGRPKGVMVAHRGVVNLVEYYARRFELGRSSRVLQFGSFSFDASVAEMFTALRAGAALVLAPREATSEPDRLKRILVDEGIDYTIIPPAMLMAVAEPSPVYPVWLETGGEACPPDLATRWAPGRHFFNGYGPTEASIAPTLHEVIDPAAELHNVSIGRPIPNTEVYVLDAEMRPVPPLVAGELYIGGIGVARGYLGKPDLTAERFVPNPFDDIQPDRDAAGRSRRGTRLYRTGDLVRFRKDGDLEYLGRVDNQVKIRGYRIELGEIEAALAQHPQVKECAVLAWDDPSASGVKRLVAYFTSLSEPAPSVPDLRAFLLRTLPDYMVPARFVTMPALPVNAHGKLDRKALPPPTEAERAETGDEFLAPSTPAERVLAQVWAQVLGVPRIGANDNFFELGGDSILSIQVVSRANQAGLHLTPKQLFQAPTLAALAALAGTAASGVAEQGPVTGPVSLTPIQHWFFDRVDSPASDLLAPGHWNQSVLLGVDERLDPGSLSAAVAALLEHHDALRLRFSRGENGWQAENAAPEEVGTVPFEHVDLATFDEAAFSAAVTERSAAVQSSLDIVRGPLMRVVYFDAGPARRGRLLLVIHHLAVDGVSWRILLEDLQAAYAQNRQAGAVRLPPRTVSFKAWSETLAAYAGSETVRAELDDWLGRVGGWISPLPVDHAHDPVDNTERSAGQVAASLSAEETRALLTEANAAYNSEVPDLLLCALAQAMEKWTGSPTLYAHLEGHGREEIGEEVDISRTVGWFTSMYPVRIDLPWGAGPGEALVATKEQLRAIPQRGLGYGLLRYLGSEETRAALAVAPEPELTFNYLGQFDQVLGAGANGDGPLGPAPEPAGPDRSLSNRRSHLLDVAAAVAGGRLGVSWTYSRAAHAAATIQQLADWHIEALRELIAHCRSPEAGAYSPSDFPLAELDQKQLDKILKKVARTDNAGSENTR
ncbi:MAG: amino acid adenylation domain-containing protein [Anaerolineae bacterium]|nr:amino acid adenylation domain-containing protein [Anaerolineae bacterium]